jgi:ribose 5-phosphate isomerase A
MNAMRIRGENAASPQPRPKMNQDALKSLVGIAALAYVTPGSVVGVGTGSTVNHFIDALATSGPPVAGAVSSSERTSERLRSHRIPVLDANQVEDLPVYIDGADEIDHAGCMIKGGGGALTREKIVAEIARRFVCIADESKLVGTLGRFALPVEVIPAAAAQVARAFRRIGGRAVLREAFVTDNGCRILDIHGLSITDPLALECEVNQWPGVVTVGIFARNKAAVCLLGTERGVKSMTF